MARTRIRRTLPLYQGEDDDLIALLDQCDRQGQGVFLRLVKEALRERLLLQEIVASVRRIETHLQQMPTHSSNESKTHQDQEDVVGLSFL